MRYTRDKHSGFRQPAAHYLASLVADRKFTEALRFHEDHRAELDTLTGSDAACVCNQLAIAANGLSQYREALKFTRKGQHALAGHGDSDLLAEIFLTMGNSLRKMGEMKQAEQAFRDAESIFRRSDSDDGRSRALNLLAGLFFRQNDFSNALDVLLDAIELVRRRNDSRQLAFMLGNLGRIYSFMGRFGDAEKHLRTNIDLSEQLGDQLEECRARLSLGYLLIQKIDLAHAADELETARQLAESLDAHREMVMYLTYLGELEYRAQRYDQSRRTLDMALRMANEIGTDSVLTGRVLRHQAELAVRTGEYRLAGRKASGAMVIMERVDSPVEIGALLKIQAIIAASDNDAEQAGLLFSQAIDTLDESGVRFEKADALLAAGTVELFSARERLTYLFRAEEFFSRSHLTGRLGEVERLISALDDRLLTGGSKRRRAANDSDHATASFVTNNTEIRQFTRQLPRIAELDLPLLLTGETGVGKDHMARYFHSLARPHGPYIAINCASVPETLLESELFGYHKGAFTGADSDKQGLFMAANGGVLFLDEIGDMPLALQGKLLGVLESRKLIPLGSTQEVELDVKLIAATNQSLEEMVAHGSFRRDLYYRLSGMVFRIPALRDRKEDIPLLLELFMKQRGLLKDNSKPSTALVRRFVAYDWPGNTRELYNKIKRLSIMTEMAAEGDLDEIARGIFPDDEPSPVHNSFSERVEQFERKLLVEALLTTNGNKSEAARMLGIHEATVRTKMKRYDITLGELRAH